MIYVQFSDGALGSYLGMSEETVTALLEGKDFEFIDEETYLAAEAALRP